MCCILMILAVVLVVILVPSLTAIKWYFNFVYVLKIIFFVKLLKNIVRYINIKYIFIYSNMIISKYIKII